MKKLLILLLVAGLGLSACGSESTKETSKETVTIEVANEEGAMIDLDVPLNPERIVVLDYVALDMLLELGLEDKIVGSVKASAPSYLQDFLSNEDIVDLGGLKTPDEEAMMELQPDIIFTSGRSMERYADFSQIAPTVCTTLSYLDGTFESFEEINLRNAKMFGMEEEAQEIIDGYSERVELIREFGIDKSALLAITTGGEMKTLGNSSRVSMITTDLGFSNIAPGNNTSHGNDVSYEFVLDLEPNYVFALDRDSSINAEGAVAAEILLDNAIMNKTYAAQNDNIIYLTSDVWYLAEGGLKAMDIMLSDVEVVLSDTAEWEREE